MIHKVTVYIGIDDDEEHEELEAAKAALSEVLAADPIPRIVERLRFYDPMKGYTHYMHVTVTVHSALLGYVMEKLGHAARRLDTDMTVSIDLRQSLGG